MERGLIFSIIDIFVFMLKVYRWGIIYLCIYCCLTTSLSQQGIINLKFDNLTPDLLDYSLIF